MFNLKMTFLFAVLFSLSLSANVNISLLNSTVEKDESFSTLKKVASNFSFNYFVQYVGRSLSNKYQDGATYNRFDGGTTDNGERLDATGSTQVFQSFKLGYRLPRNMVLSYGLTYQDNLNENINFKFNGGGQGQRQYGRSFNNHRVSLWIPSVYTNNSISLSFNTFVERPTTEGSQNAEMQYGLGIQPSLTIFSSVPGLFHGIRASVQRDYYNKNETSAFHPDWCKEPGFTCEGVDKIPGIKRTTLFAAIGGYLNYMITDNTTLKSSIEFDWSQTGDDVNSLDRFSNNLDDVASLSVAYNIMKQITVESGVNFAVENVSIDKTAIFGSLNISI